MTYVALPNPKKNSLSTTLSDGVSASDIVAKVAESSVFYDDVAGLILEGILFGFDDVTETKTEEIKITGLTTTVDGSTPATSGVGYLRGMTRGVGADGSNGAAAIWGAGTKVAVQFTSTLMKRIKDDLADHETNKAASTQAIDTFGVPGTSNTDRDANTTNHGLLLKAVAPATGLINYIGIAYGETIYALKALFDATAPAKLGTEAVGSAATAARRDHVHSAELDLADGKSVKIVKALGTDLTASGITVTMTAHENVAFGNVCFINASGEAAKTDADAAASMPVVAMAIATISADAAGLFLFVGIARDDTWNWTPGAALYADTTTAGGLTATAPTGTTDCVQIVGRALTADIILFKPDNTFLELT